MANSTISSTDIADSFASINYSFLLLIFIAFAASSWVNPAEFLASLSFFAVNTDIFKPPSKCNMLHFLSPNAKMRSGNFRVFTSNASNNANNRLNNTNLYIAPYIYQFFEFEILQYHRHLCSASQTGIYLHLNQTKTWLSIILLYMIFYRHLI